MPWSPEKYSKYKSERFAPFDDLIKLINRRENMDVIDLGCGTGELTSRLADYLPGSRVTGIDSSEEMLAKAHAVARPGLGFELRPIETVSGEWDLIFSHAAIHWVEDHRSLVPRLLSLVRPKGQLAVQLPSNHNHPTHTLITKIASEQPFRDALTGWVRRAPVLALGEYAELLYAHGGREITAFENVYAHELDSADDMAEWTSSTTLVPYFERLPESLHEPFMNRYRAELRKLWPSSPVFYGFQRIIFAATRPV